MIEKHEHYLEAQQDLEAISYILSRAIGNYSEYLECKEKISEYLHEKAAKKSNASSSAIGVKSINALSISSRINGIGVLYQSN